MKRLVCMLSSFSSVLLFVTLWTVDSTGARPLCPWDSSGRNTGVGPCFRGSSQPKDQTQVSHIADKCFTVWATREALNMTAMVKYWNFVALFITSIILAPWAPGNHGSVSVTLYWFAFSRILCKWNNTLWTFSILHRVWVFWDLTILSHVSTIHSICC